MSKPIEDMFTQLRICIAFAANKDPITDKTAIRAGLEILENTGHFTLAIREWRLKADALKTLPNFRTHFALADIERKRTATSRSAGYHQAAQVSANTNTNTRSTCSIDTQKYYYCWSHGLRKKS